MNGSNAVAAAAVAAPSPPPGVSAAEVQRLVDRAATFALLSVPAAGGGGAAIRGAGGVVGLAADQALHRLQVITDGPGERHPLRGVNRVGERVGGFRQRWLFAPDDFVGAPGRTPPPIALDPSRSQRFVLLDAEARFGERGDGFRGFGAGHTLPGGAGGGLRAMAVGTVLEGSGRFAGLEQSTWVSCGTLDPARGFTGNLLLRVGDPAGRIPADRELSALRQAANPEPDVTYLVFRGQAVPSDPVRPRIGADGRPTGLIVEQGLRRFAVDCAVGGAAGLRTTTRVGPLIGGITANVTFDPSAPGGSAVDPIPFTAEDEFVFDDAEGRRLGTFTANSSEGRVFKTLVGGVPGIRFGGVGRIHGGTGVFAGISGLMTDNSVVVFEPHVSASVYVLRVDDPGGRFRSALGGGCGCGGGGRG